jgi:hypothetical protein
MRKSPLILSFSPGGEGTLERSLSPWGEGRGEGALSQEMR